MIRYRCRLVLILLEAVRPILLSSTHLLLFISPSVIRSSLRMGGIADVGSPLVGVSILPTEGATTTEKGTGRLGTFWTETRKEIRHDLKSTRWRHSAATYFTWLLFGLWLALLLLLSICVPLYTVGRGSFSAGVWSYCGPNGSFSLLPTNPWNIEWTFQIITGWGPLSFTEAKIIDLAWDIVGVPIGDFF